MESQSIVATRKVSTANLTSTEQQLQEYSLSPDQDGFDPHPPIGTYNSPNFNTSPIPQVLRLLTLG